MHPAITLTKGVHRYLCFGGKWSWHPGMHRALRFTKPLHRYLCFASIEHPRCSDWSHTLVSRQACRRYEQQLILDRVGKNGGHGGSRTHRPFILSERGLLVTVTWPDGAHGRSRTCRTLPLRQVWLPFHHTRKWSGWEELNLRLIVPSETCYRCTTP
jgi:hypothetical protein